MDIPNFFDKATLQPLSDEALKEMVEKEAKAQPQPPETPEAGEPDKPKKPNWRQKKREREFERMKDEQKFAKARVEELARVHTKAAMDALYSLLRDKNSYVRMNAAQALLDRAWGKPKERIEADVSGTLTHEHRAVRAIDSVLALALPARQENSLPLAGEERLVLPDALSAQQEGLGEAVVFGEVSGSPERT